MIGKLRRQIAQAFGFWVFVLTLGRVRPNLTGDPAAQDASGDARGVIAGRADTR